MTFYSYRQNDCHLAVDSVGCKWSVTDKPCKVNTDFQGFFGLFQTCPEYLLAGAPEFEPTRQHIVKYEYSYFQKIKLPPFLPPLFLAAPVLGWISMDGTVAVGKYQPLFGHNIPPAKKCTLNAIMQNISQNQMPVFSF